MGSGVLSVECCRWSAVGGVDSHGDLDKSKNSREKSS